MIDVIIGITIGAIVTLILGTIAYVMYEFGPGIVDYIKRFIRWNRRK